MCRLFGFRSVVQSQVHSSLVAAENALGTQSNQHPDGWGVAYYVDGCPQLTRSPSHALGDQLFHQLSAVVASQTVLAHVRKATQGANTVLNCHPFQHGRWVFAHNGDIPSFQTRRDALLQLVAPRLRAFILGDTDSELLFYILLSKLAERCPLDRFAALSDLRSASLEAVALVRRVTDSEGERALLTFIITDGSCMLAHHGGKPLFLSTYKQRCSERDLCPHLRPVCEAPSESGFVNHFIISSEPLGGENVWQALTAEQTVGVDGRMQLHSSVSLTRGAEPMRLPVV